MKNIFTRLSVLALGVAMLGLSSCTEEDIVGGGNTQTNGIATLSATSLANNGIRVRWTAGTSTDTVYVTSGGALPIKNSEVRTQVIQGTTYYLVDIPGLATGGVYTIQVRNDDGVSNSIQWAPAFRTETFRLWETAAPIAVGASGVVFNNDGTFNVVSTESADSVNVDLVLATENNAGSDVFVALVSPSVTSRSGIQDGNSTVFADSVYLVSNAGGSALDNDFYTGPLSNLMSTANGQNLNRRTGTAISTNDAVIAIIRTEDNHYARIEIIPQSNGQLYGADANGYKFTDIRMSFQTAQGVPYAARPVAREAEKLRMNSSEFIRKN